MKLVAKEIRKNIGEGEHVRQRGVTGSCRDHPQETTIFNCLEVWKLQDYAFKDLPSITYKCNRGVQMRHFTNTNSTKALSSG